MDNSKPRVPKRSVTEPCEIDYSSPYAVMKEMTDADFTSVPLDEPAFFEVVTNDQVNANDFLSLHESRLTYHYQGEPVSRQGSINWSDFESFLDLKASCNHDT